MTSSFVCNATMVLNKTDSPFPEPFGGVPVLYDVVPTSIFLLGFTILTGINISYMFTKTRHTNVKFASILVPIERLIILSFRIVASVYTGARESWAFLEYPQVGLGTGIVILFQEQVYLLVCAVTSATREDVNFEDWIRMTEKDPKTAAHRREERVAIRKWGGNMELVVGMFQFLQIWSGFQTTSVHYRLPIVWVNAFRFCANCAILFAMIGLLSMVHKQKDIESINIVALKRQRMALSFLVIVPIFRAATSFQTIPSLTASSSRVPTKLFFYLCQLLPELIACSITILTDYRNLVDTGIHGDWPRSRIERGLPVIPPFLYAIGLMFMPWKWRLWSCISARKQMREARIERERAMVEERERLLPIRSSAGWASSIELSTLGGTPSSSSTMQVSNQEKTSAWPATPSRSSLKTSSSSSSYKTSASSTTHVSKLVTEVNLWRPSLPSAFSFKDESHS